MHKEYILSSIHFNSDTLKIITDGKTVRFVAGVDEVGAEFIISKIKLKQIIQG